MQIHRFGRNPDIMNVSVYLNDKTNEELYILGQTFMEWLIVGVSDDEFVRTIVAANGYLIPRKGMTIGPFARGIFSVKDWQRRLCLRIKEFFSRNFSAWIEQKMADVAEEVPMEWLNSPINLADNWYKFRSHDPASLARFVGRFHYVLGIDFQRHMSNWARINVSEAMQVCKESDTFMVFYSPFLPKLRPRMRFMISGEEFMRK